MKYNHQNKNMKSIWTTFIWVRKRAGQGTGNSRTITTMMGGQKRIRKENIIIKFKKTNISIQIQINNILKL